MSQPLQTRLKLLFGAKGVDVSRDLTPDLLDFTYSDKAGGEADELVLNLKDDTGKWSGDWLPEGGEKIQAYLASGTTSIKLKQLFCGTFYVDKATLSGPPRRISLSAVSIPLNFPIRRDKKKRAWEGRSLKDIAQKIANEAGLTLMYDSLENPTFDRQDQNAETDLSLLKRLCDDSGLTVKVTDVQLVIFNQKEYEQKDAVQTYVLGSAPILSWSFEQAQSEKYKSCTVSYRDPKQKKAESVGGFDLYERLEQKNKTTNPAVMTYTATDETVGDCGQEFELKKRATSIAEAKRLAEAKLRELNKNSFKGSMQIIGDPSIVAGVVIELSNFGNFDGKFFVDSAVHSVGSGGYTTSIEMHKVIEDY